MGGQMQFVGCKNNLKMSNFDFIYNWETIWSVEKIFLVHIKIKKI